MRAIILAAVAVASATTRRAATAQVPVQFGGASLLERHLRLLKRAGVDESFCARLSTRAGRGRARPPRWQPRPQIVLNARFDLVVY